MLVRIQDAIEEKIREVESTEVSSSVEKRPNRPFTHAYIVREKGRQVEVLVAEGANPPVGIEVIFKDMNNKYGLHIMEIWPEYETVIAHMLADGVKSFLIGNYSVEKRGMLFFRDEYLNIAGLDESLGSPVLISK